MSGPSMTIADIRTTQIRIPFVEPPALTAEYNRPREILAVEIFASPVSAAAIIHHTGIGKNTWE